jgi:anti-anti-sigma factor
MTTSATVDVHTDRTSVRIAISGEIDLHNSTAVEDQVFAAIDNSATSVLVDLTGLRYMDSSGLRILFTLVTRLDVLQINLDLVAEPGSPARHVLELAGFESLVQQLRP